MELFKEIISFLVKAMIFVSLLQVYLRINKIWKRKHEREVADSQSIYGLALLFINCLVWILYYMFVEDDPKSAIDTSIILFETSAFLLVSTGLWVKGQKRLGLMTVIKQALRLERKEADYLIKRFFKPQNAEVIINILHQLAMIDEELDEKEMEIIAAFAREWNIPYSVEKLNKERFVGTEKNYIRLRSSVNDYLDREPPVEQVAQFKDIVNELIKADSKVTKEEELISSEILGMIADYLSKEKSRNIYQVIIVPQREEQEEIIKELQPESQRIQTAGGVAYSIGTYYSTKYAEMICKQNREHNLFTIVYKIDESENPTSVAI